MHVALDYLRKEPQAGFSHCLVDSQFPVWIAHLFAVRLTEWGWSETLTRQVPDFYSVSLVQDLVTYL